MAKAKYVRDERIAVCMQGLRYVETRTTVYGDGTKSLKIDLAWKGSLREVTYKDEAKRDAMFEALCDELPGCRVVGKEA